MAYTSCSGSKVQHTAHVRACQTPVKNDSQVDEAVVNCVETGSLINSVILNAGVHKGVIQCDQGSQINVETPQAVPVQTA